MSYRENPKSYWDDRINDKSRYSSVGKSTLPNTINKYRREKTFGTIQQALRDCDISIEECTLLDAGCGTGIYSEFYAALGADVTGVDLSDEAVEQVHELGIPGTYLQSGLQNLPVNNREFDITHCFAVLYHIVDDHEWKASLAELDRVTKPDGYIFLRIGWLDEVKRPGEHVKIRDKDVYKRELCKKRSYSIEGAYTLQDEVQYEELFKTVYRHLPDSLSERISSIVRPLDLFVDHPEQKLVILKKPGLDKNDR